MTAQVAGRQTSPTLRATAHPVRLQILSLLTGAAMSAAEVARELGLTHANASYHLRTLATSGLVVEAGEERIRGGVAKRYRHPWEATERQGFPGTPEDEEQYVQAMAQELVRRYARRERAGSLTDAELWVAPEVLERVRAMVLEAALLLHAEARPPRSEGTVPVAMTAAVFPLAADATTGKGSR
jgi:DNA-binding transcriptional ArsR family regulator